MKKVTAILTALVLALGLGSTFAMAEEDYKPSTPEMKVYESIWVSNDGNARVWIGRQDDGFQGRGLVERRRVEEPQRRIPAVEPFERLAGEEGPVAHALESVRHGVAR